MGNPTPATACVRLPDGARLYAELRHEPQPAQAAPLTTVIFLHGWTLDRRLWRNQIAELPDLVSTPVRLVAYDLRGHGRSTSTGRGDATLAQLADDLDTVLNELAPEGRVVLVGHSLGGMAIMEYAHRHPDTFAARVAGAVFVSTSAEGSSRTSYGLRPHLAWVLRFIETQGAALLARSGRWRPHRVLMPLLNPGVRWLVFGQRVDSSWVALTSSMVGSAALSVIGGFRPAVALHHRVDALAALRDLPVAVLVGSADRLTPRSCAETIANALPRAEYSLCDGAGHMLPIERPDAVSSAIARICATVDAQPVKRSWLRRRRTAPKPRPAEAA